MSEYGYAADELQVTVEARSVESHLELRSWVAGSCLLSARD